MWALLGRRAGDNAQVERLMELAGWSARRFVLTHNRWSSARNLLLGASLASLRSSTPPLTPPWPDVVIGVGQRSVPVARWIRARSGGSARLAQLGRPQAPLDWFDLVITTPQYALPERDHVIRLPLPLTAVTAERLHLAAAEWRGRLEPSPRPLLAVVVGGPSQSVRFGVREAALVLTVARERLRERGGSLLIATSPRTPPEAADLLERDLPEAAILHRWDRPSPAGDAYLAFLAVADEAMVTQDSVSMLADALAAGLPTRVIALPEKWTARWTAFHHGPRVRRLVGGLERAGLLPVSPDLRALREDLTRLGMAQPAEGGFDVRPTGAQQAAERRAVAALRALADPS